MKIQNSENIWQLKYAPNNAGYSVILRNEKENFDFQVKMIYLHLTIISKMISIFKNVLMLKIGYRDCYLQDENLISYQH